MLLNTNRTKADHEWISKRRSENKRYVTKQSEMVGWNGMTPEKKRGLRESWTPTYFPWVKTRCDCEIEPDSSSSLPLPGTAPSLTATLLPWGHMGYKRNFQRPSPSTITLKKDVIEENNVGLSFLVFFIFNSSLWGCIIYGVFYGVKHNTPSVAGRMGSMPHGFVCCFMKIFAAFYAYYQVELWLQATLLYMNWTRCGGQKCLPF